jgi:hypothetical protein
MTSRDEAAFAARSGALVAHPTNMRTTNADAAFFMTTPFIVLRPPRLGVQTPAVALPVEVKAAIWTCAEQNCTIAATSHAVRDRAMISGMRADIFAATLCLTLALSASSVAAERCEDAADKALFSAKSWNDLGDWRKQYPECDDGYLAEYVSVLVGQWLSAAPEQLALLARAVEGDPPLMDLVARHIDMTLSQTITDQIRVYAERQCQSSAGPTCLRIIRALDELDEEVSRIRKTKE